MKLNLVDLHMHSVYSDGSRTPYELLEIAKQANVGTIAITDHDNIDGSKELIRCTDSGLYLYSGVELTAKAEKGRMHILGYNIDLENERLNKRLVEMKDAAIYNLMLYVEILKKDYGVIIPTFEIEDLFKKNGNVGRPDIALLLIKYGYCTEVEEAFQKYLIMAYEKVRKIKKGLTKEECVDLIINAGGVVSLAHPSSLKMTNEELEQEVAYLKSLGMECIEIQHINNKPEQREYYRYLAEKYQLMESGGTDFHGYEVKPDVSLGSGRDGNVHIEEGTLSLTKNIKSRYMRR